MLWSTSEKLLFFSYKVGESQNLNGSRPSLRLSFSVSQGWKQIASESVCRHQNTPGLLKLRGAARASRDAAYLMRIIVQSALCMRAR